nr:glycosyltransferase [Helicobacter sp. 'house sparrow 1']
MEESKSIKETKPIKVAIIVPIFNVQDHLKKCLDSLLHQTYKHFYAILVNDGSSDNSLAIAKQYALKDARFFLIDCPNGGVGKARNRGIDFLKNSLKDFKEIISLSPPPKDVSYIEFLDSDDFLDPNSIEQKLVVAQKHNLDVVGAGIKEYSRDYQYIQQGYGLLKNVPKEEILHGLEVVKASPFEYFHAIWGLLISFKFFKENNLSFIEDIIYEDHNFGIMLFLKAKKVMILKPFLYNCVLSANSITRPNIISPQRLLLNYQSYRIITDELIHQNYSEKEAKIIKRYIKKFYLPTTYSMLYELKIGGHNAPKLPLKNYKDFLSLKTLIIYYLPSLFGFLKRLKTLLNKKKWKDINKNKRIKE